MNCCNENCQQGRQCSERTIMDENKAHFFKGALLGVTATALIAIGAHKINSQQPKENILPSSVIEAYNMGLTDALRTNPVSPQLEQVCVNLWAGRQPYGPRN
jgi:hypothetical protein